MASANDPINALESRIARVKSRLISLDTETFEQLQNVSRYRLLQSELRSTGWLNILLGGFTLWLGLSGFQYSWLHVVQSGIGALTLAISLWAVIRPRVAGVRAFSVSFLVAGIWNFYLCFRDSAEGYGFPILLGLLALAQLWWAYQCHKRYQTQRFFAQPSATMAQTYNEIIDAIRWSMPQRDADFVEVKFNYNRWKGWLLGDFAVLSTKKQLMLSRESNVSWTPQVTDISGKRSFRISIRMNEISATGTISQQSFDRYAQWKLQNNPDISAETLGLLGTGKITFASLSPFVRLPVMLIAFIIIFIALLNILRLVWG